MKLFTNTTQNPGNGSQNRITSLQEITIRRINRAFQIEKDKNKIKAYLPLSFDTFSNGNCHQRNLSAHLLIENNGKEFRARLYKRFQWKCKHWRNWRNAQTSEVVLTDGNFYNLIKQVKSILETSH